MFSFYVLIVSRDYHLYKDNTWSNAKVYEEVKVGNEVKVEVETDPKSIVADPYSSAIKSKHSYFIGCKTVGHIQCEIPRNVYFFKEEDEKYFGTWKSLKYKESPIPSGGLEIILSLKFS